MFPFDLKEAFKFYLPENAPNMKGAMTAFFLSLSTSKPIKKCYSRDDQCASPHVNCTSFIIFVND